MSIVSKIYVTRDGCVDRDAALNHVHELGDLLRARYERGELRGFESCVLASDDDYAENDLEYMRAQIEAVTGGALPAIWVNVTFPAPVSDDGDGMAELVTRFGLIHLITEESAG